MTTQEYLKISNETLETIETRIGKIKISRNINSILTGTSVLLEFYSGFVAIKASKIELLFFLVINYMFLSLCMVRTIDYNMELHLLDDCKKKLLLTKEKLHSNT